MKIENKMHLFWKVEIGITMIRHRLLYFLVGKGLHIIYHLWYIYINLKGRQHNYQLKNSFFGEMYWEPSHLLTDERIAWWKYNTIYLAMSLTFLVLFENKFEDQQFVQLLF